MQQHYLSANYTHVLRDAIGRGLNVLLQLVAPPPAGESAPGMLSLGSNPDLTVDLLPHLEARRAAGLPFALVGQRHRELPFMYGDALVPESCFDYLVDEPPSPFPLFAPPNLPIGLTEHAIALNVSALVRDGGTLQLGIGELGDAITSAISLRHRDNQLYLEALAASGLLERNSALIGQEGGTAPFEHGLYACSEMLVDGFLDLYGAGVLKRHVFPSARLQRLLDEGAIGENVGPAMLEALAAAGLDRLSPQEFAELRAAGVFRDEVRLEEDDLVGPDGSRVTARLGGKNERSALVPLLGDRLQGVLADAGFFLGPRSFYSRLRDLPVEERRRFAMRGIGWVNDLAGPAAELKAVQRRHARFVNTTMMVTGLGAAVSDGLADGRVVSGVGGQYNFVAMAHALPQARSILCLRSTRRARRWPQLKHRLELRSRDHPASPARYRRDRVRHRRSSRTHRSRDRVRAGRGDGRRVPGVFRRRRDAGRKAAARIPDPGGGARESRRQACGPVRVSARSGRVSRAAVRVGSDRGGDRAGPCPEMAEIGGGVLARPAHRRAPGTRCESRFRRASPRSSANGARGTGRGASTDRAPPRRRGASLDQVIGFTSNNQP